MLKGANLKTARAWALKESLRELWDCRNERHGAAFWKRWYFWATHSRLPPMIAAAKTIAKHLPNVLTYVKHPISNAMAEGLNSKVASDPLESLMSHFFWDGGMQAELCGASAHHVNRIERVLSQAVTKTSPRSAGPPEPLQTPGP